MLEELDTVRDNNFWNKIGENYGLLETFGSSQEVVQVVF